MNRHLLAALLIGSALASPSHAQQASNPTAAGASATPFVYRPGIWWQGMRSGGNPYTLTASRLDCGPVMYWAQITPTKLGSILSTASGTNFSLFIYANDPTTDRPTGAPLLAAIGLNAAGSPGTVQQGSVSGATLQAFTKYWECAWADTTPKVSGTGISNNMSQIYGDPAATSEQTNGTNAYIGVSTTTPGTYSATAQPTLSSSTSWSLITSTGVPATRFQN